MKILTKYCVESLQSPSGGSTKARFQKCQWAVKEKQDSNMTLPIYWEFFEVHYVFACGAEGDKFWRTTTSNINTEYFQLETKFIGTSKKKKKKDDA